MTVVKTNERGEYSYIGLADFFFWFFVTGKSPKDCARSF